MNSGSTFPTITFSQLKKITIFSGTNKKKKIDMTTLKKSKILKFRRKKVKDYSMILFKVKESGVKRTGPIR
jgi:hypothetical protein